MAFNRKKYIKEYMAKRRKLLKRLGLCCDCGAEQAEEGHVLCNGCREARKRHYHLGTYKLSLLDELTRRNANA